MRIAHIVCTYPPYYGGMGNTVFEMVRRLSERGHDVQVFTPAYYEPSELKSVGAPVEPEHADDVREQIATVRRIAPEFQYGNAARLGQILDELDDFDVVHLHYPFFGTANLVRKWKKRHPHRPLVITYHMDTRAPDWRGVVFKLYAKFWMPRILASADMLIASSFDFVESSDAAKSLGEMSQKWIELPFGVDVERFMPREKPVDLFKQFELDPEGETLLFVGGMDRAHYFKGVPVLLEALYMLKENNRFEPQVVLIGDGELRAEYEHRAALYGLRNVRFVGHVDHDTLPYVYNMPDLFVLPSINRGEAFGLVILEAMASGVPVVASDLPGVRMIAEYAGNVVPPGNSADLAQAIYGFFAAGERDRRIWKQNARLAAQDSFSWDKIIDQLEMLYSQLARRL